MSTVESLLGGRYRLIERIATGGMGTVWRAQDEVLHRPVAVKILNESLAEDDDAAARFEREARAAASISHPNMANVFDFVTGDGRPAIVMELVDGETLADRLARDGALPPSEAIRIARGILRALEAAHVAGIVHRDIKPGNVLLTANGGVKVADLGIARTLDGPAITTTGMTLGTAQYAAPEQVEGRAPTPQADIYATGVVLYEMLTGTRPFTGDSPAAVALARLSQEPEPPSARRAELWPELEAVVMRALQRALADRYGSATEMREALQRAGDRAGTAPLPPIAPAHDDATMELRRVTAPHLEESPPHVPPAIRRRLALWLLPLLGAALLSLLGGIMLNGLSTTTVPRFTGMKLAQARALAEREDLTLTIKDTHSSQPKDTVLRQSLPAGRTVDNGTAVTLTVSDGVPPCCDVPDLLGMSLDEARAALEKARLDVGQVSIIETTEGPSGVRAQYPPADERVQPGSSVDLTVVRIVQPERDEDRKGRRGKGNGDGDSGD